MSKRSDEDLKTGVMSLLRLLCWCFAGHPFSVIFSSGFLGNWFRLQLFGWDVVTGEQVLTVSFRLPAGF